MSDEQTLPAYFEQMVGKTTQKESYRPKSLLTKLKAVASISKADWDIFREAVLRELRIMHETGENKFRYERFYPKKDTDQSDLMHVRCQGLSGCNFQIIFCKTLEGIRFWKAPCSWHKFPIHH
jgi:hypothetical protein